MYVRLEVYMASYIEICTLGRDRLNLLFTYMYVQDLCYGLIKLMFGYNTEKSKSKIGQMLKYLQFVGKSQPLNIIC